MNEKKSTIEKDMVTFSLPPEYHNHLDNPVHWIKDEEGKPVDFIPFNALMLPEDLPDEARARQIIDRMFYQMSCIKKQAFEELSQLPYVEINPVTV